MTEYPLILFTNDDGIESPGLWAVVKACSVYADCLITAPRFQQSGVGRSLSGGDRRGYIHQHITPEGEDWLAYAVEGTPAQSVQYGVLEIANRHPDLVVSGINYGDNLGNGVTISGTIGAALEAASLGIPAIAVSQQTPSHLHLSYSDAVDFAPAAHFAQFFGRWLLNTKERPTDIDILKIDLPIDVTLETPWRITRLSKKRVYWPTLSNRRKLSDTGPLGYAYHGDAQDAEPGSDVYVVLHEGLISVTPMSLDMTSRVDFDALRKSMGAS